MLIRDHINFAFRSPLAGPVLPGEQRFPDMSAPYDAELGAAMHRAELADKWQQLGEILRYRTSLPPRLSELAILVTARHCNCQLEWYIHDIMARKAGLEAGIIEDIRAGRISPSASASDPNAEARPATPP